MCCPKVYYIECGSTTGTISRHHHLWGITHDKQPEGLSQGNHPLKVSPDGIIHKCLPSNQMYETTEPTNHTNTVYAWTGVD